MKKKVIVIYSEMIVGGSTTSLLSLLNSFDYNLYTVDLQLYSNAGVLQSEINKNVNILPALKESICQWRKYINPFYVVDFIKAGMAAKKTGSHFVRAQYLAKYEAMACRKSSKCYDVGISYLEFFPMEYLRYGVNARCKIAWIHVDVKQAGLLPKINSSLYEHVDRVVLVSKSCEESIVDLYPECRGKSCVIENMLDQEVIRGLSRKKCPVELDQNDVMRFVSVCRIVFAHKGLDRALKAFAKLKEEGVLNPKIKWYIIGDGVDSDLMKQMVVEEGLQSNIVFLGLHSNPYSVIKKMDVFLLPSRYEGKPMAVTEAQMLGVVPVVCRYSSANEQIEDTVDGLIANNDDNDILHYIRDIVLGKLSIDDMKRTIKARNYTNTEEIEKVNRLIEEV